MQSISKWIFSVISFSAAFALIYFQMPFLFTHDKTEGMIVGVEQSDGDDGAMYAPRILYADKLGDKQIFIPLERTSWNSYDIGERENVYLKADGSGRPHHVSLGMSVFVGVLICFGIIGLPLWAILLARFRQKKLEEYKLFGDRLEVNFSHVEIESKSKGRIDGYRVCAQYHDEVKNEMYTFKSHLLAYDPTDLIDVETITVFTKKRNHKKYAVDLSFLPVHVNR